MDITVYPQKLTGTIPAIPSKSQAHRLLICAAFANAATELICPSVSQDMEATAACLNALGASIRRTDRGFAVSPITAPPACAVLDCRESGATLRFLLPIVGALGVDGEFHMAGRLPSRPLSPLWEEMERMGCSLSRPAPDVIRCRGRLRSGAFTIPGNISSQFITGLLFAATLMAGDSQIHITGTLESAPYVAMTQAAMALFGVDSQDYAVSGGQTYRSPGRIQVEGDWSNAAFFLSANALGSAVQVTGLDPRSPQGDRAILDCLEKLEDTCTIDAAQIPDLIPVLAIVAGAKRGARFVNAGRLRLKETDRLATTAAMLRALGGEAKIDSDTLIVAGTGYRGGTVDASGDHRIAMAAAVAATVSARSVTILCAHEVQKSYLHFWEDYKALGGNYEQYLR